MTKWYITNIANKTNCVHHGKHIFHTDWENEEKCIPKIFGLVSGLFCFVLFCFLHILTCSWNGKFAETCSLLLCFPSQLCTPKGCKKIKNKKNKPARCKQCCKYICKAHITVTTYCHSCRLTHICTQVRLTEFVRFGREMLIFIYLLFLSATVMCHCDESVQYAKQVLLFRSLFGIFHFTFEPA